MAKIISSQMTYPESDGKPIAENTLQFQWIVTLQGNLDALFLKESLVFVAGDLLWYPVEGNNRIAEAPDVMVALGRPKGHRGSYLQWQEGNVAPQVVFEVLSPSNRTAELLNKFQFYGRYGVEEYYLLDPFRCTLDGWLRKGSDLEAIESMNGWISPRLNIRFEVTENEINIYKPDSSRFLTHLELHEQEAKERRLANSERERADNERERADNERERADSERQRADSERERVDRLAARLRELGENLDD